jgi:hypothetical protein
MEIRVCLSRSGLPTCVIGELWLHSRYDPESEALRFARERLGSSHPSYVVLLGPCLDYLGQAVRSILPRAKVLAIQLSDFFESSSEGGSDTSWNPASGVALESFLDASIDEDAISGVAVLEWEPAARAFPAEARAARSAIQASLDRLISSSFTVRSSGRRWIANACASFLLAERLYRPSGTDRPIVVAASGPSLERALKDLPPGRGGFILMAVSSALRACLAAGRAPDLVVASDGGYWSRLHLFPLAAAPLPLASPLTALPSASIYRFSGLMVLNQGSFVESELLPSFGASVALPPHGTVSGTAIQLAARLSAGPIIVAGLDLASHGEKDHARPHGFDPVLSAGVSRFEPLETRAWNRSLGSTPIALKEAPWRSSRSLQSYASALGLDSRLLAGRLFRLRPSPMRLGGFVEMDTRELCSLLGSKPGSDSLELEEVAPPSIPAREDFLREKIASWKDLSRRAALGLAEGQLHIPKDIAELLRSIDIVDYAAARRAVLAGGDASKAALDLSASCESFLGGLERRFAS